MKRCEFVIDTPKVKKDLNIGVVSDMHADDKKNIAKMSKKVLDTLEEIKPTHIVIAGDLFDEKIGRKKEDFHKGNEVLDFLNDAQCIAPVFYTPGDSDPIFSDLKKEVFHYCNPLFHLLDGVDLNSTPFKTPASFIDNNYDLNFLGLRLPAYFYDKNEEEKLSLLVNNYRFELEKLKELRKDDKFNALICHDPIVAMALQKLNIYLDLIISGHNHGGIIPSMMHENNSELVSMPTFREGMYDLEDKKLVVSKGITKYSSEYGIYRHLEHFHEGTVENIRILKREKAK